MRYFPRLYPGETFYSAAARYIDHTLDCKERTIKYLGIKGTCLHPHLPGGVNEFIKRSGLLEFNSIDELLSLHTPYSFYSKFLNAERQAQLKASILFDANSTPIKPSRMWKTKLMYCPLCVKVDIETLGETYWRMEHQLPFLNICLLHNTILQEISLPIEKVISRNFVPANLLIGKPMFIEHNNNILHKELALKILNLNRKQSLFESTNLIELGKRKGVFLSAKSIIHVKKSIKQEFQSFVRESNLMNGLESINLMYHHFTTQKVLGNHYLIRLLLEIFLERLPEEELYEDAIYVLCINPLCPKYETVIPVLLNAEKLSHKNQLVRCPECELAYIADLRNKDRMPYIRDYGTLVSKTIKILRRTYSLKDVSEKLKMSRKKVCEIDKRVRVKKKKANHTDRIKFRRKAWLAELQSPEFISITASSRKLKTEFGCLSKIDRAWFVKPNEPYRKKRSRQLPKPPDTELDNNYIKQLKSFLEEFKQKRSKARISTYLMSRVIGCSKRLLPKLPLTSKFIKENNETRLNHIKRKVKDMKELNDNRLSLEYLNEALRVRSFSEIDRAEIYSLAGFN